MKQLQLSMGLLGALLLFPSVAWGADGDTCAGHGAVTIDKVSSGAYKEIACIQLCDEKAGADSSCLIYDFDDIGMPDILVFEFEEDPANLDCQAFTPDITITTSPSSTGAPAYTPASSDLILNNVTDRIVLITAEAPLDRYLVTAITDDDTCTDFDVRMHMLNRSFL